MTFQGVAAFDDTTFQGDALFRDATFRGFAWFGDATFQGDALFDGATFQGGASFGGATAKVGVDIVFDLPSWPIPFREPRPFRRREEGETPYRLAKQAAQSRGDYRRAGDYHFAEQCAVNHGRLIGDREDPWKSRFLSLGALRRTGIGVLEFILARSLFGYGEKPHRALIAGLAVILLCSLAYWGWSGVMPSRSGDLHFQPGFGTCLYFSTVTFTTLGYGDFQPKPDFFWFLAGAEAASGAALMALFIVGLARKYTR